MSEDFRAVHRPQLESVHRVIADKSCAVLSLDIFDTVLWRRVPRPADAFGLLAVRLRQDGKLPDWVTDASFRRMRIAAEREARLARGSLGSEVSLFDIWRAMPLDIFRPVGIEELVQAEVELERAVTVVDLDIANVIQLAKKYDIPVTLVSDTYFTEEQLAYLLDRPELGSMRDVRVFRSHQHGADKASGLWEIVLKDLGRSPEQLMHIGDNKIADDEVPAGLGVRTVHYKRIDDRYAKVLDREQESSDPFGDYARFLDAADGDFGLTSLRAKVLQAGAPDTRTAVGTAWRYGAAVLGPVLTGFAEWVAHTAHEAGTRIIWCPMREGELLSELVNEAAQTRGWAVTAKPIWLSRQVTSVAALDSFDTDAVREFIRKRHRLTVRQLLEMLHLRPGDVPCLATELDIVLDNERIVTEVSVALTETPHLKNRLAVATTAARERLVKALRAAGALEDPDMTLVDLGWGGTIQLQLARVLKTAEVGVTPSGLYLATDNRSTKLHLAGLRAQGFLGQAGYPHDVVFTIVRSPEVVEQSVNALCGSLVGFAEDGSPVLGPHTQGTSQDVERKAVQDGIRAFQRQWNRYVVNSLGDWPDLTDGARPRLANILTASIKAPTTDEASLFGNWQHEDNFGSSVITKVLPEDLVPAIPYLSPNDLNDLNMRDSFWPALIAASDTRLSAAARALANGVIEPSLFEPAGEAFETHLRFRTSDDEWHDGPRRRVRINHNGLSFARMDIEAGDVQDVSLAIPGRPAVVRIDWIEAKVIAGGNSVPRILRWDKPEDFAGLTFAECTWLGANMVEFTYDYSALWLPLATQSGAPVTSAQITVAFAMLPQSTSKFLHRMPAAARVARISGRIREEYRARGAVGIAASAARVAGRRLGGPK
jgi:FMN phosphatase YigB (HAD superfamily)